MKIAKTFAVVGALATVGLAAPAANAQWLQQTFQNFQGVQGPHQQALDVLRSAAEQVAHRIETTANRMGSMNLPQVADFMNRQAQWLKAQLPNAFTNFYRGMRWGGGGLQRIADAIKGILARANQANEASLAGQRRHSRRILETVTQVMSEKIDAALQLGRAIARGEQQRQPGQIRALFDGVGQRIAQAVHGFWGGLAGGAPGMAVPPPGVVVAAPGVAVAMPIAAGSWLGSVFSRFQVQGPQQQALDVVRSAAEQVVHRLTTTAQRVGSMGGRMGLIGTFMTNQANWLRQHLPNAFNAFVSRQLQFGRGGFRMLGDALVNQLNRAGQTAVAVLGQFRRHSTAVIGQVTNLMQQKITAALDLARNIARGTVQRQPGQIRQLFDGLGQQIAQAVHGLGFFR